MLVIVLFGLCKTYSIVAKVVDGVPLAEESIAQDDKGTSWLWDVKAHERADAAALNLENVVVGGDCEVVSGQGECQIRQAVALVALNRVLAVVALWRVSLARRCIACGPQTYLLSAHLLVE